MELVVHCTDPSPLDNIMTKFAKSVKCLEIAYDGMAYNGRQSAKRISFPRLKFLYLMNKQGNSSTNWYFNGDVPNLVALFMQGSTGTNNWPKNVIYMGTTDLEDLSKFPQLRLLHLSYEPPTPPPLMMEYLRSRHRACPDLRAVTLPIPRGTNSPEAIKSLEKPLDGGRDSHGLLPMNYIQLRNICKARISDLVRSLFIT